MVDDENGNVDTEWNIHRSRTKKARHRRSRGEERGEREGRRSTLRWVMSSKREDAFVVRALSFVFVALGTASTY